ncbi:MAG: branched-chain amino acid ABC transporter permease [Thermoleophilia bacterium]
MTLQQAQAQIGRYAGRALVGAAGIFAVLWVIALADNAAYKDPKLFLTIGLNAISLAAIYFVVASGFTLIFGLMRIVNMAHGSFFLLGGYFAFHTATSGWGSWGLGILVAALGVAAIGLIQQQVFLRWNQGQDLRQALITIAISIILADQMLAHFGGTTKNLDWPPQLDFRVNFHVFGLIYPFTRIFVILCALAIGTMLFLWLRRTRTGMVIRAGVDDRAMVSALGINIQLVFAMTFMIGSALAAFGGVLGGTLGGLSPGVDNQFLLNSLIVVIIGGMGSLGGAAIGALLYGFVDAFSDIYLPQGYSNYSVLLTFGLLVFVLAVRPFGLFGRAA